MQKAVQDRLYLLRMMSECKLNTSNVEFFFGAEQMNEKKNLDLLPKCLCFLIRFLAIQNQLSLSRRSINHFYM